MLQRMSTSVLVFEWDDETGDTTMVTGGGLSRDRRWEITEQVWTQARRLKFEWEDLEWRERAVSKGCVPWESSDAVLMWRAKFKPTGQARTIAQMIAVALGFELDDLMEIE